MRNYKILFFNVNTYPKETRRLTIDLYPLNAGDIYIYSNNGEISGVYFMNPLTEVIYLKTGQPLILHGKKFEKNNWILDIHVSSYSTLFRRVNGALVVAIKSYIN